MMRSYHLNRVRRKTKENFPIKGYTTKIPETSVGGEKEQLHFREQRGFTAAKQK